MALKGLEARLKEIHAYLELVVEGKLPLNHEILYHLQVGRSPALVISIALTCYCTVLASDKNVFPDVV